MSKKTPEPPLEVAHQKPPLSDVTDTPSEADPLVELRREVARLHQTVEDLQRQNAELVAVRQAFEAEHRRYHEMFESAPDGYVLTTLDGVIREANRAAAALLGVRQDSLLNKSLLVFVDEKARADLEAEFAQWHEAEAEQARRPPPTVRGQIQLRVYKGASFPAEYAVSPTRDEHGHVVGLRWILRDLSENARTEQALRERNYHYRTLFDHAGDAIFIHNLTGRFLEVNRVACDFLGYTREELLRMKPADVVAPELVSKLPVIIAQLQHEDHIFFEMVMQRQDGTTLPMELNSRIIEYAGGPAVLSIARDITERKRGEDALRRWAAQLALLSNIGRQIAAILGLAEVFEQAARLVQENFGYHHVALFVVDHERHELVMKAITGNFVSLFPPNHRIPLGQGMVGWVGQYGRRLLAANVDNEPHYINFYPDLIPTRSELSVPIRTSNQTVGVLDVQSPELNAFDENDTKVMEILTDQIAVAMANAQLYEAAQEARRVTGKLNPAHVVKPSPGAVAT